MSKKKTLPSPVVSQKRRLRKPVADWKEVGGYLTQEGDVFRTEGGNNPTGFNSIMCELITVGEMKDA